jgi:hypothetical protein
MELLTTYQNGNRIAKVYSDPICGFTVEYFMHDRIIKKTHHVMIDLAEELADDFIAEAGSNPTLLNENII